MSFRLPATLLCDFYKLSHRLMYPNKTELVYSTWTPRATRMKGVDEVVVMGNQAFIKEYLVDFFNENFFNRPLKDVVSEYVRVVKFTLGVASPDASHIEALHKLGYLPLLIKGLPEGTVIPLRVPALTIQNTHPEFFWVTNYIESLGSCELWPCYTAATIALQFKKLLDRAAMRTVGDTLFVPFQGHDFSMRGMLTLYGAVKTGMGHLASFVGTDTIPAILAAEYFYGANIEKELVGTSIAATEHSIECTYDDDDAYVERMITEVHPNGFVSVVADGRDFWDVIGRLVPKLKDKILARKGGPLGDKVVLRPDSGDPVLIVCGDPNGKTELERKGAVEALWDIFGGTFHCRDGVLIDNNRVPVRKMKDGTNILSSKGIVIPIDSKKLQHPYFYKVLDSHIGLIYGDAITLRRAEEIVTRLEEKGFASINIVFGIGSYTYQYNTRDTFGFALKSTACVIDGKEKQIFKDPKTDDGIKKSQKGAVHVYKDATGKIKYTDGHSIYSKLSTDMLQPIFLDGKMLNETTFAEVRERLANSAR